MSGDYNLRDTIAGAIPAYVLLVFGMNFRLKMKGKLK